MPPTHDRDIAFTALRIIVLLSGFYLLTVGSLALLRTAYVEKHNNEWLPRHQAVVVVRSEAEPLKSSSAGEGSDVSNTLTATAHAMPMHLDWMFSSMRALVGNGVQLPSVWWLLCHRLLVALGMVGLVVIVIDVYRAVADFVATTYVLHLIIASLVFGAFPTSVMWWMVLVCECATVMTLAELVVARRQRASMVRHVQQLEDVGPPPTVCAA